MTEIAYGRPDLNESKPWSDMAIEDLRPGMPNCRTHLS